MNPDLVMEPNYLEEMLKAFEAKSVGGAATGKLYKISEAGIMNYELWKKDNSNQIKILDTTGVNISKSAGQETGDSTKWTEGNTMRQF